MLVSLVATLTCGLLSGGVAYAHSGGGSDEPSSTPAPHRAHGARGTVAAVDGTTFVLTRRDGTGVTVTTSDATVFRVTTTATVADAVVGSYVVVHGKRGDDGTLSARSLAIKSAPTYSEADVEARGVGTVWRWRHGVAGQVTANDPATGLLTIATPDGDVTVATAATTKVVSTTPGTIADLPVGARVGVHGVFADDGTLAADRVKVLPAAPVPEPTPVPVDTTTTTTTAVEPAPTTTAAPSTTSPSTASPGTTSEPPSPADVAVRGIVASLDDPNFTMTTRDGTTVAVATDANTRFVVKDCDGAWNKRDDASTDDGNSADDQAASISDVAVGAEVKVVGTAGADGTVVATAVLIGDGNEGQRHKAHDDDESGDGRWGEQRRDGRDDWRGSDQGADDDDGGRADSRERRSRDDA